MQAAESFDLACLLVGYCCEPLARWQVSHSLSSSSNSTTVVQDITNGYPGKLLATLLQTSLHLPPEEIQWLMGKFMKDILNDPQQFIAWQNTVPATLSALRQNYQLCRQTLGDFIQLAMTTDRGRYDARTRTAYYRIGAMLGLQRAECCRIELEASRQLVSDIILHSPQSSREDTENSGPIPDNTAKDETLPSGSSSPTIESLEAVQRRATKDRRRNWLKIGLAAVGGGVAIGLTGGLAAPLIGAGLAGVFGAVGIGGTAVFLGSAGGVALLTTLFGATGLGLSSYKMAYRVRGVREFRFISHSDPKALAEYCLETVGEGYSDAVVQVEGPVQQSTGGGGLASRLRRLLNVSVNNPDNEDDSTLPIAESRADNDPSDDKDISDAEAGESQIGNSSADISSAPPTPSTDDSAQQQSLNLPMKSVHPPVAAVIPPPYVIISITGWMTRRRQAISIWQHINSHLNHPTLPALGDHYSLCWETRALVNLGRALETLVVTETASYAAVEVLKKTILAGLMSALVIPASLISVMAVMDNPFSVAYSRARKAGQVLADVLLHRRQGNRPVTLVGTSLGAKVIFECLLYLNELRSKDRHALPAGCGKYEGIIENIVLIGAPISPSEQQLRVMHSLVSGRIVNAYCRNDWILGFLLRAMGRPWGIAGIAPIELADRLADDATLPEQSPIPANEMMPASSASRIENIDLTDLVNGHSGYTDPLIMRRVLDRCLSSFI